MKIPKRVLVMGIVLAAGATPFFVEAALIPSCALGAGRCGINDIVQTFVNFGRLLLGFVGSAVLVFFVYGGFVWLTSGGSTEKIQTGKNIVVNSIIGLIIVFGAFTIVQFVSESLGAGKATRVGQPCTRGRDNGIYVLDPRNPEADPTCVTSCSVALLKDAGYECRPPAQGENCIPKLCPGTSSNVCCQARSSTP